MPTITLQVVASSDDCFRKLLVTPAFSLTRVEQRVGYYDSSNYKYGGGMRFLKVTIPPGATITQAYLRLRANVNSSVTIIKSRISAEKSDSPPTFSSDPAVFDARWANRTNSKIDWDNIPAWTKNTDYNSPEIKTVIQEIINRPGWASDNALVIFWEDFDNRSSPTANCFRDAYSYDGDSTYAPKLIITYITILPPTVTTQAVTDITYNTATGKGTITATGGENCSKRGVCWNKTGNPTIADSKSEQTDSFGIGAFSRPITGLSPSTHYFVKAYAYNSVGYGYGAQVEFTTKSPPPPAPWAAHNIEQIYTSTGYKIILYTFQPCHLWMRWTTIEPQEHLKPRTKRGLPLKTDKRFCFVGYEDNEQEEAGDTLEHTFIKEPWPICQTRWFYFHGTIATVQSPSTTAIFKKHRGGLPPTQEHCYATGEEKPIPYFISYIQSWIPPTTRPLTKVILLLRKEAIPDLTGRWISFWLYKAEEDGKPSADPALYSAKIPWENLSLTFAEITVPIEPPITIVANQPYCIVLGWGGGSAFGYVGYWSYNPNLACGLNLWTRSYVTYPYWWDEPGSCWFDARS